MNDIVLKTYFKDLTLLRRGKVRDIYECGEHLIMVMTDRLSAFDVVLPNGIPGKGNILTEITSFWFNKMSDIIQNHLVSTDIDEFPQECKNYKEVLAGRSMFVKKALPVPIECIVRGYLSGSGWKEYKNTGEICGIKLSSGLRESEKLPQPIFAPSTKAEEGHDINISVDKAASIVGKETINSLKDLSLSIYTRASDYAEEKGIIIADTKFEFGFCEGELMLIDEVLTPDSSRFWKMNDYKPGKSQDSFDKQIVRDYLLATNWDKTYPGPELPDEIINKASSRYKEILDILTNLAPLNRK